MKNLLRPVGAVLAGFAVSMILFLAGEGVAAVLHPFPEGFDPNSPEQLHRYIVSYPTWMFAAFLPLWGLFGFAGAWTAWRLGNVGCGLIVGGLWVAMVVCNVLTFPYPTWFKVAMPIAAAAGVFAAYRTFHRTPSNPAV